MILKDTGSLICISFFLGVLCMLLTYVGAVSNQPLVTLIVYDGFRWDYLDMVRSHYGDVTPNLDRLIKTGVTASHVVNVFPTVTMATHMSLLTGLYSESHGVVANHFYDPRLDMWYHMGKSDSEDSRYFNVGSEPIWVTNQKASSDRYTGAAMFPDTFAAVKDVNVTYRIHDKIFNKNITFHERVDTLISWFLKPQDPINLALFYYQEPDITGHDYGPESTQLLESIMQIDNLTGYLLNQLSLHGLRERMNLIFTADHGMTDLSQHKTVNIDDYVHVDDYNSSSLHYFGMITPKPGLEHSVFRKLKKMEAENRQVHVFWKNDTSPSVKVLHYSKSDRIPPILIVPDLGWLIIHSGDNIEIGGHGFNNSCSDMWPFFIANGPVFRENVLAGELHQIDIYELMCHILRITPAPNNGSLSRMRHLLRDESSRTFTTNLVYIVVLVICGVVAIMLAVVAFIHRSRTRTLSIPEQTEALLNNIGNNIGNNEEGEESDEF